MKHTPEIPLLPLMVAPPRTLEDRRQGHSASSLNGVDRRLRTDRRAAPRVEVELEVEERLPHRTYIRTTRDLSLFGLSFKNGKAHARGAWVSLSLQLPDQPDALDLRAQVVGPSPGGRGGVRLAFRSPPIDAVKKIHRFIRSAL